MSRRTAARLAATARGPLRRAFAALAGLLLALPGAAAAQTPEANAVLTQQLLGHGEFQVDEIRDGANRQTDQREFFRVHYLLTDVGVSDCLLRYRSGTTSQPRAGMQVTRTAVRWEVPLAAMNPKNVRTSMERFGFGVRREPNPWTVILEVEDKDTRPIQKTELEPNPRDALQERRAEVPVRNKAAAEIVAELLTTAIEGCRAEGS